MLVSHFKNIRRFLLGMLRWVIRLAILGWCRGACLSIGSELANLVSPRLVICYYLLLTPEDVMSRVPGFSKLQCKLLSGSLRDTARTVPQA